MKFDLTRAPGRKFRFMVSTANQIQGLQTAFLKVMKLVIL